jgi:asparagine synthase (glutamine-hydrolysing)
MSVLFGIFDPSGPPVRQESLEEMASVTARYGPDATSILAHGAIGMAYQAFHTHGRSSLEQGPTTDTPGNMIVFDGRLDNYQSLSEQLTINACERSDSSLVLKAFERWGRECFSHLVGDWALALWSVQDSVLYLARDHAGTRTLFYRFRGRQIMWSTYLDSFIASQASPDLNMEYLIRVLCCQAVGELTPYRDIHAVPPAHYIAIHDRNVTTRPHWNWVADSKIVYRTNAEYDEHFLHLIGQAIKRRTGPGAGILAELSGGMDSSSIVCVSDHTREFAAGSADLLDTISYYDDTEPDWDDRNYFEVVERFRHKEGYHVNLSRQAPRFEPLILADRVDPYFRGDSSKFEMDAQFEQTVGAGGYRVIISGIGGDELLGGVPNGMPELADHLRHGRLLKTWSRAFAWCLAGRQSLPRMICETAELTIKLYRARGIDRDSVPPWLRSDLRGICLRARTRPAGAQGSVFSMPSAIANGQTWWAILETLPSWCPWLVGCYEYRFPYLDRDLVDFLHRVPREQLVQPGRRRFLMRRALQGIVPTEILERRRKAFVSRGPINRMREALLKIEHLFDDPMVARYGLIDRDAFLSALHTELSGDMKWLRHIKNTIEAELWLRGRNEQWPESRSHAQSESQFSKHLPLENGANEIRASSAGSWHSLRG